MSSSTRQKRSIGISKVALVAAFVFILGGGTAFGAFVVSSNSQIGPNTVSGHKPPAGKHANIIGGSVNATDLANGAVTGGKLAPASVTNAKIGFIPQARVEFSADQIISDST